MCSCRKRIGWVVLVAASLAGCGGPEAWSPGRGHAGASPGREVWTIDCGVFDGPNHRKLADELAEALRRVRGLRVDQVTVNHEAERSIIYYGAYDLGYDSTGESVVFSDRIREDLKLVRSLSLGPDQFPFLTARAVPRPSDDLGPPEWNLESAHGAYTLQVGYTHNTATFHERKRAAVDWVRDLRNRHYEAYYYHSPGKPMSIVTVGTFDESAVENTGPGQQRYSQTVRDLQAREELGFNLDNGQKVFRINEEGKKVSVASFLVRIPDRRQMAAASR